MLGKVFRLGRVYGIPVKMHWSFLLIFLLLAYMVIYKGLELAQVLSFSLLVVLLFICVLLHELGHVIMAKYLGIRATDIILSPIGGLARLEPMDAYPRKEILVALAGPMVNFIIALGLFIYLYFIAQTDWNYDPYTALSFISLPAVLFFLFFINVLLFLFNLIPAFPMDGGRILRAALSFIYPSLKATYIASVIGRIFALLFLTLAFVGRYYALIIIGLFVYFMALSEYRALLEKMKKTEEEE